MRGIYYLTGPVNAIILNVLALLNHSSAKAELRPERLQQFGLE